MGKAGCVVYLLILGGIGVFLIYPDLALTVSRDVSAIQLTQVYTGAMMWLLAAVCIGIGLLILLLDDFWGALKKYLDPRFVQLIDAKTISADTPVIPAKSQMWEYCELIEGKQAGQRQMLRKVRYSDGVSEDIAPETMLNIVKVMGNEGWELVAAPHTQYANAAAETRWIFRRAC